ncbi:hypothetical protein [uncultured Bifidobacterium sp.]|uniref:hypothetical protein n=1 Tax=uncultured Bifidobacterium sp. TaxID=165187 RepID=UPI0028DCBD54|nr:hypothetical protein [uncultured Bifidobacterium sp.]
MSDSGVTVSVRSWTTGLGRSRPVGRALVMPGIGYTVDRPLLYWSARALLWQGWQVDRLDLGLQDPVDFPSTIRVMDRVIDRWAQDDADAAPDGDASLPRLVVTKSLSTLTYPHLAERGIPAVLMTPVLNPPPFDPHRSVIPVPDAMNAGGSAVDLRGSSAVRVPPLVCAGDADPYFDAGLARRLTDRVLVLSGGNHSIEVPGDWRTSLTHLRRVVAAVADYASCLVR